MTLTKADIVEEVYETIGFTRKKSCDTVECLLEIIKLALESGDDVLVSGFGKFVVQSKAARNGRNPATCESLRLRARKRVAFKCSGKLRDLINGAG
jgi:integration host factor subunit alpha